jgi:hypothetical protein
MMLRVGQDQNCVMCDSTLSGAKKTVKFHFLFSNLLVLDILEVTADECGVVVAQVRHAE